ncbi:MAG: Peptidoglycan O-acetyltransferase [Bacteroidetes bacterium ADurb.Bin408]|nr:MAG: Peptidoglycan O-acetyltransferase [Bacteroidetes bacterium ADurb.Bin408]
MLPYSIFEFYMIIAFFAVLLGVSKYFFADRHYRYVLFFFNAFYLVVVYPQPLHFVLFIAFSYGLTWFLTNLWRPGQKLWGVLLLLLPLLLVKLDIRFHFYPFTLNHILSFAGLSFAAFRVIGYYMAKAPEEKMADPVTYFNFLSFTPTLLIGPIDTYAHFKSAQDNGFTRLSTENYLAGWQFIVRGIVFKYVLAEITDRYWLSLYSPADAGLWPMVNTMYAYYVYLFFDFAGYSHLALGIGKIMGMDVPLNFTNPFLSVNPQDFWRRFHISLGNWLKDNFFTPLYLFLTRQKALRPFPLMRQNTALVCTFGLMGCWNGLHLNFILSGLLFGLYSAVHNTYVYRCRKQGRDVVFGNLNPRVVRLISVVIMLNLAAVALYIFSGYCPLI